MHKNSQLCVVSDGKVYDKMSLLKLSPCSETNEDQVSSFSFDSEAMLDSSFLDIVTFLYLVMPYVICIL